MTINTAEALASQAIIIGRLTVENDQLKAAIEAIVGRL